MKLDDDARLQALAATGLMDTLGEPDFDRVTRLICQLLPTDVSLVSLVDASRQFFKSACGLPAHLAETRETPLSHSFCQHVVTTEDALIVRDARADPRVRDNLAVRDLNVIAYLGVPLRAPGGMVIGSLCAIHMTPRLWSAGDEKAMRDFAAIVEDAIALRNTTADALDLARRNDTLAREYNHRAKNLIAVATALVRMSARDAASAPEMAEAIQGRLQSYAHAHDALADAHGAVILGDLLARLLAPYAGDAKSDLEGPFVSLNEDQVAPLCLIVHELATNSAKYGAIRDGGRPRMRWAVTGAAVSLIWSEDVSQEAREARAAPGFGDRLLQMAAGQLGGKLARRWEGARMVAEWTIRNG